MPGGCDKPTPACPQVTYLNKMTKTRSPACLGMTCLHRSEGNGMPIGHDGVPFPGSHTSRRRTAGQPRQPATTPGGGAAHSNQPASAPEAAPQPATRRPQMRSLPKPIRTRNSRSPSCVLSSRCPGRRSTTGARNAAGRAASACLMATYASAVATLTLGSPPRKSGEGQQRRARRGQAKTVL